MELPNKLKQEIEQFCLVNNIDDVDQFIIKMVKTGFNIEKYGISPVVDKIAENIDNSNSMKVQIRPKASVQDINIDMEIRPTGKKDLYGE